MSSTISHPEQDLLNLLREPFPTVSSYETVAEIPQPNALGLKLKVTYEPVMDGKSHQLPEYVFIKQVTAAQHGVAKKDWSDLRRLLLYARTECRFYRDFVPIMQARGFHANIPKVYFVDYNLADWIEEDDEAACPAQELKVDMNKLPMDESKGGFIILECIPDHDFFQDSPLTVERSKACLEAVAKLHASTWQDTRLLLAASKQLSRASFHLSMRNPKELEGMVDSWNHFASTFRDDLEASGVWTDRVEILGERIQKLALYISEQVSPHPTEKYASMIHGDYKAMNVFLPKRIGNAKLVDFASVGIGLGMSDVAMHIHHSLLPEHLENGVEEDLVKHYWNTLVNTLISSEYPWEEALRHYKYAVVDYFRFFLGRFWKSATQDSMEKKKSNRNVNLINRSVPAACAFVGRADRYLAEIEEEYKQKQLA